MPSQKLGRDKPISEVRRDPASRIPFRLTALTTANGIEMSTDTTNAETARSSVAGKRSMISVSTGWPLRIEVPRSPWSSPPNQCKNWLCIGMSSPK